MYARYQSSWEDGHNATMNAESYRAWVSLSRPQTELRIGLQRLNFGSARILRPLQWFDTLDPLDPHQYTSGVEAALLRHHWLNNANLWVWVIRGTELRSMSTGEDRIADVSSAQATKSLPFTELRSVSTRDVSNPRGNPDPGKNFSSKEDSPELGGRVQYPSPLGDLAFSYHHRKLEQGAEDRAGLDLRMDHTIGSWIEASVSAFRDVPLLPDYILALTLGADYNFNIGN
ncbi:MAG: hypothetical protein LRZ88_09360, partial [Candidatus Cloacimonetes bacterium]|nr:hypothetical protein [Candidatus Cloacimonadota bacterium]